MPERNPNPATEADGPRSEEEVVEQLAQDEEHYTVQGEPEELHTDADPHRHDGADWNTPTA